MSQRHQQPLLTLDKQPRIYQGMVCGLRQQTLVVAIGIPPLPSLDFPAIDAFMEEWIAKPCQDSAPTAVDPATALLRRIHHWQATVQEEHSIPVFGDCQIEKDNSV